LDWWLSLVPNYRFIDEEFVIPDKTDDVYVRIPHWPAPKAYNPSTEHYKVFPVGVQLLPNMGGPLRAVYKRCVEMGAQFSFSTWARQLIRPNNEGRVQGVIAQDKDGNYIKYIANKGVVLCTGDYSGDTEMLRYYLPDTAKLYPPVDFLYQKDANGVTCHTGDGHKMGMWVGGQMEPGPHAPMTHNMGGPLGTDAFLLVNVRGQRFMNEDTDGQNFTNAIERQPKAAAFQIFDDNWRDQLACQGIGHGQKSSIKKEFSKGKAALAFTSFVTEGSIQAKAKQSDTLEGLAKELGLPVDSFIATLKRYNELARAGKDADYYKRADRMFPIEKAPFYGGRTMAYLLVVMSGLETNEKCEVLDQNYNTILGLYAAGNAQGGRFSIDYPMTCVGVSHGMALTFGRLAGTEAAKG
jgi:succinate dehydrogenase/fumarate reductase flavoprotein subunit